MTDTEAPPAAADDEKLEFIEEIGLAMESQGMPRMAGRILGALLMADPPEQSAEQLANVLQASRGSISTMTRLLEAPGLIERVSKPGDRKVYYRNRPDAWFQATRDQVTSITAMKRLAEKGLRLLEGANPEVRLGVEEMHEFLAFWEREMPAVLDHWYREKKIERD